MSKMKKLIALATLLLFVFTTYTFNVSAAGTFSDVDPSHQYAEAIQKLYDNKIVDGYLAEDGTRTFMPDNTITRAEFAKLLAVSLVPDQGVLAATPTGFSDVDKDEKISWAIPYISYAVQSKIVNGYPDGTFQPFKEVTYAEAVKMVVCAVGYGEQVEVTDPWYDGYLKIGRNVGVLDNALSDANTASKRGLVAQLIMNLNKIQERNANIPIIIPGGGEGGGSNATIVLPEEDEAREDEGQITAVFENTLSGRLHGLSRREIMIDSEKYTLDDGLNPETYIPYLGYECDFEYIEDGRKNVIKKLTIRDDYEIYEFKDDSNVESVTESQIEFYKKDTDSKTTKLNLRNVKIVYNGYGVEGISASEKRELLDPAYNSIKFLDNSSNKTADVAFVEGYETYFVGGVALDTHVVTDKYRKNSNGTSASVTLDVDENVTFKTDKGVESSISALVKDKTTISVYGPYSKNGYTYDEIETFTNVIVSKKTVKGVVTSYDDTTDSYTIGTKVYKASPYYMNVSSNYPEQKITIGDNATYYLDHLDRIVYVSVIDSSRYGYITSAEEPDRASKNEYILYMITNSADGAQVPSAFTLKDNITINGKKYDYDEVFERLKASADIINDGRSVINDNAEYSQPIIFKTTVEGGTVIRDITTIDAGIDGEGDSIEYGNGQIDPSNETARHYYSSNIFKLTESSSSGTFLQMKFSSTTGSTKVFVVPNDRSDEEDYAVYTKSSEVSKYFTIGNTYLVEGFDVSSKIAGIIVVYGATPLTIDGKSPAYIVRSKVKTKNAEEDNEDAFEFTMFELGKKAPEKTVAITLNNEIGADIKAGDIIKFAKRGNSIGAIEKIFVDGELYEPFNGEDVEGSQELDSDGDFRTDEKVGDTAKYYTSFAGTVYMTDNESVLQLIPGFDTGLDEESDTYADDVAAWETNPLLGSYTIGSSSYVYIFDGSEDSENRIKFVNAQSLQYVSGHGASNASKVYMYRISGGTIKCIVVYKNVDFIE